MTHQASVLREEIERLALSPVEWCLEERMCDPADFFDWLWRETYAKYQVDSEVEWIADPYSPWDDEVSASEDELHAVRQNLRDRRPEAAREYIELTRRFWALTPTSPTDYPKHHRGRKMIPDELARASRGNALLNAGLGPGQILDMFWVALVQICCDAYPAAHEDADAAREFRKELKTRLFSGSLVEIVMQTAQPVGASKGEASSHICFKLEASTPTVHAYPITNSEAQQISAGLPIVQVSDFDGFLSLSDRSYQQRPLGRLR